MMSRALAAGLASLALAGGVAHLSGGSADAAGPGSPNVVLILTDDQTSNEFDPSVMPQTAALIRGRGVTFSRFYTSFPFCCPSRATFLSGEYMHNHQVRGNLPPFGGQHVFADNGTEGRSLPVWLKGAGYDTAHVGKYLNGYGDDGNPLVPPGWDEWYGQISDYDPAEVGGKLYYDYKLLEKGLVGPPVLNHYGTAPSDYQGDVLLDKTLGAIDDLSAAGSPFYLEFAPHAPHYPFTPPPRYAGTAAKTRVPKLPGLNEKNIRDKPFFLRSSAPRRLKRSRLGGMVAQRRMRLEQLHSVDDYVAQIVGRLSARGELSNTYLIFASDNGYFFGEHRFVAGKFLPYEPSARVPFAIAGPGLPAGAVSGELTSNADFAPTVAALAGAGPSLQVDGRSMLPYAQNPALRSGRPILLEGDVGPGLGTRRLGGVSARRLGALGLVNRRGAPDLEGEPGGTRLAANGDSAPAYKSIRTNRWVLTIYSTGETELYDMKRDPAQLTNLRGKRYKRVRRALLRRLILLAHCAGPSCNVSYRKDPKARKARKRGKKNKGGKRQPAKGGGKQGK